MTGQSKQSTRNMLIEAVDVGGQVKTELEVLQNENDYLESALDKLEQDLLESR